MRLHRNIRRIILPLLLLCLVSYGLIAINGTNKRRNINGGLSGLKVLDGEIKQSTNNPQLCTQSSRHVALLQQCERMRSKPPRLPRHAYDEIFTLEDLMSLELYELKQVLMNMIVDESHKLVYCSIPKAGCTSWKHYLWQNNPDHTYKPLPDERYIHHEQVLKERGLNLLNTYNKTEIEYKLRNYFKLIVVRHPLDRLISTYVDKFNSSKTYYKERAGVRIIKRLRRNPSNTSLLYGHDVSFEEFVKYIIYEQDVKDLLDWHWENYQKMCFPCAIRYDYVAKLETNEYDSKYVINNHLSGKFYDQNSKRNGNRGGAMIQNGGQYLEQYKNITDRLFLDLIQSYQDDMDMFGYVAYRKVGSGSVISGCGGINMCC